MLKKLLSIILSTRKSQSAKKNDIILKTASAVLLGIICLVMSIMNVAKEYNLMAFTTIGMALGFFACAAAVYFMKDTRIYKIAMSILVGSIFTYYAISGQNYGFAILWILIIPFLTMTIFDLPFGIAVSFYFQVLLIIIFYTPLRNSIGILEDGTHAYTETFMNRFPVLYLCSFLGSAVISIVRQSSQIKVEEYAFTDPLTNVGNRTAYTEAIKSFTKPLDNFIVVAYDINDLKQMNDNYGHEYGDRLIKCTAFCIKQAFPHSQTYRIGGDEFITIVRATETELFTALSNFQCAVESYLIDDIAMSVAYGFAIWSEHKYASFDELVQKADSEMYIMKKKFHDGLKEGRNII